MPVATADELLAALRQSRLVPAGRLDGWLDAHPAAPADSPQALAQALVADGLLTPFQAGLLLKNRPHEAFIAGKYKVLDVLGKGGMGAVYLCEHPELKVLRAVKVIPASPDEDRETRERFYREARAFAQLIHPNLVRGFDVDTDGTLHYIVMEYVDGVDLHVLVTRGGPLPVGRAANYVRQAAVGLAHAHDRGWVHRDVKPANLAVDRAGVVRVLDMGLARTVLESADAITRDLDDGYIRGTADFVAPEQADGSPVDCRCDIYALGITLYFLLTGRLPFDEANTAQKLIAHVIKKPLPIRSFRPDLPEGLARVVEVMMAKQPEFRYQTGADVAAALAPWDAGPVPPAEDELPRRGAGAAAGPAVSPPAPTAPLSSPAARRRKNRTAVAGLVLVALVAVGVGLAVNQTGPPARTGPPPPPPPTASPFMGPYVPVTRKYGPNRVPFPGGHTEYLKGSVYQTVAAALADPRLRAEDNCRILLLDEIHEEQAAVDASHLPHGISIESVRPEQPAVWWPPETADPHRPLLLVTGGTSLTVRHLAFNGLDKFETPLAWDRPGPGCQLHDVRVTKFTRTGIGLRDPAGDPKDPVRLSRVRVHTGSDTPAETCVAVAATGAAPARHLRLTDCRLEGPATQGLLTTGGVEGLELTRCRLFGLGSGVRLAGPGRLRAVLASNTVAKVTHPVRIDALPPNPAADRLVFRSNLFFEARGSAVRLETGAPAPELFRGSAANWCTAGGCRPPTPGLTVAPTTSDPLIDLDPTHDDDFLRYPAGSPLATAGPDGQPVGVPPR